MRKLSLIGAAAFAALATGFGVQEANAQATTSWSGAPQTQEGEQRFKVRGRVHYDIYSVDTSWDNPASTEDSYTRTATRRAHLGVEGRFTTRWRYRAEWVLNPSTDDSSGEVGVDDFYLEYAGDSFSLFIGEQNAVSPMEDRTSSNTIQFNERSAMINAFGFGRQAGLAVLTNGGNWHLGAAVSGDSLNNTDSTTNADEAITYAVRGGFAPIYSRTPDGLTLLHIGGSVRHRNSGDDALYRYRARPGVGFGARYVDTAAIGSSDTYYGAELAGQWGPFGVQAEYGKLEVDRVTPNDEVEFSGYYIDAFWSLTGESRNFNVSDASFGRISPARPMGQDGGWGHWMLAARYENVDLSDGPIVGGEQTGYTLGLQWNPIAYVTFRLNVSHSDIEDGDPSGGTDNVDGEANVVTLRTQFDF